MEVKHINGSYVDVPAAYQERSEEIEEIVGQMPHWILRKSSFILFCLLIILLVGASVIHYPDVLITNVSIISSNPPVKLIANANGKIQRIFVANDMLIRKGQALCLLENPGDYNDIVTLQGLLTQFDTAVDLYAAINNTPLRRRMQLGELQSFYVNLLQSVDQYFYFKQNRFLAEKTSQLHVQMNYYDQLNAELLSKHDLLNQQLALEQNRLHVDSTLLHEKVIAPLDYNNSIKQVLSQKINTDAIKANIIQNKLQQKEYEKNITDLRQQHLQQENDLQQKIRENIKLLQSQLIVWEEKYLIKSPVDGKTMFYKFWRENQYVTSGEPVVLIIPPVQQFIARGSLSATGAGKVKPGQRVLIKLAAYPFEEFGMLKGRVSAVSEMAFDTSYTIDVQLNNLLTTTTHYKLPKRPQFDGVAEVLTNDKTILTRLFEY
jgi:multidrug resistance efflux pump